MVTNQIIKFYVDKRMKIFQENARTSSALYSNEMTKWFSTIHDTIGT